MDKQIIISNNSNDMFSKDTINGLILEINKLKINKYMKEFLLVASTNLLSPQKTSKALIYQLETFKKHGEVFHQKTSSKYINKIIDDLNQLPIIDFSNTLNNLIEYVLQNNVNFTGTKK